MLVSIWAESENGLIGDGKCMPWRIPAEFKHFRRATEGQTVIMGRRTWESIGKPLADRENIVASSTLPDTYGITVARGDYELRALIASTDTEHVFIIGGGTLYDKFVPECDVLIVTTVAMSPVLETPVHAPVFTDEDFPETRVGGWMNGPIPWRVSWHAKDVVGLEEFTEKRPGLLTGTASGG